MTTLRLYNDLRETGGEWVAAAITDYYRQLLADYQQAEPRAGWRLQTRGLYAPWHDIVE